MPREVIRSFKCWRCETVHEFKRNNNQTTKFTKQQKSYKNKLYIWIAIDCPSGGASISEFDPEEPLVRK